MNTEPQPPLSPYTFDMLYLSQHFVFSSALYGYSMHFFPTDIDECLSDNHGCEHICVNTNGSYFCDCKDGLTLDSNGLTCSVSCGGILTGTNGTFQSPGWPYGYPQEDFFCEWTMQDVPAQKVIVFEIDSSVYGINGRPPCRRDHIQFFDGISNRSLGRFCKRNVPDTIIISSRAAKIVFEGRKNANRPASRKGVRVFYQIQGNFVKS